ncbi:MAG: O-acetyl-ADP-ribose deacetylase [Oscillospiraceae bacterium]|nr:O-acetyl-ADP-ribose deacetylase [Oscillospiraceae bacterium]
MPFQIVRNDITRMNVDAIVNAANKTLLGGGGVDGAIHKAAGPKLLEECKTLGGCETGEAKITGAYKLPCKHVIHTVGPRWKGGGRGEKELLISCYRNSLELALSNGCESVAFPLISSGAYGYPKDKAMKVAVDTIGDFLMDHDTDMMVWLVVFGKESVAIGHRLDADIREYVDDRFTDACERADHGRRRRISEADEEYMLSNLPSLNLHTFGAYDTGASEDIWAEESSVPVSAPLPFPGKLPIELDESFQQMLLRKIDERGISDAECYKRANIDRKLFSKIRSDPAYKPSKPTAVAFAIALKLSRQETDELLKKAGFALSRSNYFDAVVSYFIDRKNYNIFEINEALFYFDQKLLGA